MLAPLRHDEATSGSDTPGAWVRQGDEHDLIE